MWNGKKGNVGSIGPLVMAFGVAVIIAAIVASIVSGVQATQTSGTASYNATVSGLQGIGNVTTQFPLLGTVIVFAIILSVVVGFLAMRNK